MKRTAIGIAHTPRDRRSQRHVPPGREAAAYIETAVPTAAPTDSAKAVRQALVGRAFANAEIVFVVDGENRLLGAMPLTDILVADPARPIGPLVKTDWPRIPPELHREEAASLAIRTGVAALAVCDAHGYFRGAVTAESLLGILRDEHMEDLHHMAGILSRSETARDALTAAPHRRALYRLPWILVGFAGSVIATGLMQQFEGMLQANIALALFIPAIVYLADAVGTQAEAVAVRGISLNGAGVARLLAGEVATGGLIGLTLAVLAFVLVAVFFNDMRLASCVAVSLFVAGSIATTIGFVLPWAFSRTGIDPALGSGPLGTVVQDVITILVYFGVATLLLT